MFTSIIPFLAPPLSGPGAIPVAGAAPAPAGEIPVPVANPSAAAPIPAGTVAVTPAVPVPVGNLNAPAAATPVPTPTLVTGAQLAAAVTALREEIAAGGQPAVITDGVTQQQEKIVVNDGVIGVEPVEE